MTPPRCAFGTASRDTRLAFVPSMPAQAGMEPRLSPPPGGRRQWTGGAGSTAFAWRRAALSVTISLTSFCAAAQCADEAPAAPLQHSEAAARDQLRQLVQAAQARSRAVGIAALLKEAAEQDLREARSAKQAQASFNASLGPSAQRSESAFASNVLQGAASVGISRLLWDGGRSDRLVDWRERLLEAAALGQITQQEQLALSTVSIALDRSRYQQHERVFGQYVRKMACLVDALQTIVDADRGRASELLQARKAMQQAELSLEQARAQRRQTEIRLQRLVGDALPDTPAIGGALREAAPLERLLAEAEQSAEVLQLARQAEAAHAFALALDAQRKPQLSWTASASQRGGMGGTLGGSPLTALAVGVNLSVPLWSPGLDPTVDAARLRARAAREQRDDSLEARRARLKETWDQAGASFDRADRVLAVLADSEKVREATLLQWQQLGRRSLFDVMGAESEHYSLRVAQVNAVHDGQQLQALLWSLGRGMVDWLQGR
jgi:adhesin transport system outer membrane protein